jgi:hypothetical protein
MFIRLFIPKQTVSSEKSIRLPQPKWEQIDFRHSL